MTREMLRMTSESDVVPSGIIISEHQFGMTEWGSDVVGEVAPVAGGGLPGGVEAAKVV